MPTESVSLSIGSPADFPEGKPVDVDVETAAGPRSLIVYRQGREVRVWLNVCPHQGRPLNLGPGRFLLDTQQRLVCAAHGAVFNLSDGHCVSGPCKGADLTRLRVSHQQGQIVVHITF